MRLATHVPWPSKSPSLQSRRPARSMKPRPKSARRSAQGMKFPPSFLSTTPCSSRWSTSTPVSITATAIEPSPVVRRQAGATFIRSSSHWKSACQGSPRSAPGPSDGPSPGPPARRPSCRSPPSSESAKSWVTERLERTLASKPGEPGTTASASIALRSPTTVPPEAVTAARICAGVVPGAKRTTVTPKGLPAAVADPVSASAAASVARRRVGRITLLQASARGCRSYITRSGKREGRLAAALSKRVSGLELVLRALDLRQLEPPDATTVRRRVEHAVAGLLASGERQSVDRHRREAGRGRCPAGRAIRELPDAEVGAGVDVAGGRVELDVRDRLVAEVVADVRPRGRVGGRVVADVEHVTGRRPGCDGVGVVARVADDRVVRIARVHRDPAREALRAHRMGRLAVVDARPLHVVLVVQRHAGAERIHVVGDVPGRVRVLRDEDAAEAGRPPPRARGAPGGRGGRG